MNRAIRTLLLSAFSLTLSVSTSINAEAAGPEEAQGINSIIADGEKEAQGGRWNRATQLFLEACSKDPSNVVALHDLAVAYAHTNKLAEAADCESKALALNESYVPAHVELAWILGKQKKLSEAREHLNRALVLDPENKVAKKNLEALNLERQGKTPPSNRMTEIVKGFEEAVGEPLQQSSETTVSKALIARGTAMFRQGKTDVARRFFEQALANCPNSVQAHSALGVVLGTAGDIDGQIKEEKSALALDPKNVSVICNLAWAQAQKGLLADSLKTYQKALAIDPKSMDAQVGQGVVLFRMDKFEAAVAVLRECARVNPDAARTHLALGAILQAVGRVDEAVTELELSAKLSPNNVESRTRLAAAYLALENYPKALDLYRQLVERVPSDAELRVGYALSLTKTDDMAGAAIQFRKALELDRNLAAAHAGLSMVQEMRGKLSDAREEAEIAARSDASYRQAAERLAGLRNNIEM